MNKEIKEKWACALESGLYSQGTGLLKDCDDRFCCLGVLTDLYLKETGKKWSDNCRNLGSRFSIQAYLPGEVAEWAELGRVFFSAVPKIGGVSAITLNDTKKLSFKEIAALIRENEVEV